jgi:3-methyladenine DNA glycosylase AlkD
MNIAAEVREVRDALEAVATEERALGEKAYLKSELEFLGADMPAIRRAGKTLAGRVQAADDEPLRALVQALWRTRIHELRSVAIALLEQRVESLGADDIALVERLLRDSRTWAYVDWLSTKVCADLLLRVEAMRGVLARWAQDDDFWVRRAALLTLMPPVVRGAVPFSAFSVLAVPMLGEKEFFIRKAIGWVLRAVSKDDPATVAAFLRAHRADVSGITLREGAKYLPARERKALLSAEAAAPTSRVVKKTATRKVASPAKRTPAASKKRR